MGSALRALVRVLPVILSSAAVASPAMAVRCVAPGGLGPCHESIQAAVDAAAPGEVINIRPGHYQENLHIMTEGLTLRGTGLRPHAVVIDGAKGGGLGGDAIHVDADNITFKNLMVVNGVDDCIDYCGEPGGTVVNVLVQGCAKSGIAAAGDGLLVRNTVVTGSKGGAGVSAWDRNFRMLRSAVRDASGSDCVFAQGSDAAVLRSRVFGCAQDGVAIRGDRSVVGWNRIAEVLDDGVDIEGAVDGGTLVRGNRVSGSYGSAITVGADSPVIVANRTEDTGDDGDGGAAIELWWCGACAGGRIGNNQVRRAVVGPGMYAYTEGAGLVVSQNFVHGSYGAGLRLEGVGIIAVRNTAAFNGAVGAGGIEVAGEIFELRGNLARGNTGDGFDIRGPGHGLVGNRALSNGASGFGIRTSTGVVLDGNRANRNRGYGFLVQGDAAGVILQRNRARGNLWTDICDQGPDSAYGLGQLRNIFGTRGCL